MIEPQGETESQAFRMDGKDAQVARKKAKMD